MELNSHDERLTGMTGLPHDSDTFIFLSLVGGFSEKTSNPSNLSFAAVG